MQTSRFEARVPPAAEAAVVELEGDIDGARRPPWKRPTPRRRVNEARVVTLDFSDVAIHQLDRHRAARRAACAGPP